MTHQLSNIEKIKQQLHLQHQVKEILAKEYVDLQDKEHFQVIVGVLEKPKKLRNANDLQLLAMAFSSIKYFQEMSKTTSQDEMLNLFRELQYIEVPARRTLFRLGDIGKNFYIILSGSVWVLVARSGLQSGTFTKKDENNKDKIEIDEGTFQDEFEFIELDDETMLTQKYPTLMKVGQIAAGGSFGEIALTNFIPRQATIVCKENSQFITLSREAFNKFLSEYYNRIQQKNFEFLKSIQIFKAWNDAELSQMQYHLQPLEYCYDTLIYKEGEIVKGVYFVLEGMQKTNIILINNIVENCRDLIVMYAFSIQGQKNIQLKLNRCGYGQLFGYLEIVANQEFRLSKAVCLTEKSKMLFLPADRFKLYCCSGQTLSELNKMIDKLDENKRISKEIFLGNSYQHSGGFDFLTQSPNYLIKTQDEEDKFTQINQSQQNHQTSHKKKHPQKNTEGKSQKVVQEMLGKIQHQPSNIQNYYEFISSHSKERKLELTFECPLIEIQQSRKTKILQQQLQHQQSIQHSKTPSQNLDSRVCLIQSLKLPKLFKKKKNNEDVQLQVYKFVRQQNQSVQLY
ncbi:unnamed protein product (macronuclear) [Paramecium tetraurelia]|uniref:Cyclic nucleotide-binding domain-containing protein n=1 Tax=Paramecium tetraurelia TaxID=5888 RepID=A0E2G6_PARTE|nr:uncharacterized protein GSPATT00022655001 [Paramecium tetraurelia]CAK89483.1 unnamed protein product [Paramecium tetraurelia]|eukprot:XP_001456880.1 hypothetical protein (macronuclear) [Paramecium tetraurelia strain d4-2]